MIIAVEQGINFIDVSPYYGYLKAEILFGKALRKVDRSRYYLGAVDFCGERGIAVKELAVSYAVSNPRIATTLFSTTNPANVLQTIGCANTPLNHTMLKEVRAIFEPGFRDSWVNS